MPTRLRIARRAVAALVLALVGTLTVASPASAEERTEEKPTIREYRFTPAELKAATKPAADVVARQHTELHERVNEYLNTQVRAGRGLDRREVKASAVADPFMPNAEIHVVSAVKAPQSLSIKQAERADGSTQVGVGIALANDQEPTKDGPHGAGVGYGAGYNPLGAMYREGGGCSDVWFVPRYGSDRDHKMTSCWEWWGVDNTPYWVHNRWQLWTMAKPYSSYYASTSDLYAAARPWDGHEWKLVSLWDWDPRSVSGSCYTAATFTIGYSGSSVSIPYNRCSDHWLDITTSTRKIGIDFDGRRSTQMHLEVAGSYTAADKYLEPINADYNWATVTACWKTLPDCWSENWVHKDSGW